MKNSGRKVYAIFGPGMFGRELCRTLSEKGASVIAIDRDPELIERMKDSVTQAVLLDSTDEEGFTGVPLENADAAIVAIGDNIEASILTPEGIGACLPSIFIRTAEFSHLLYTDRRILHIWTFEASSDRSVLRIPGARI